MSTIHFHRSTVSTADSSSPGSPTSDRAVRSCFRISADGDLKVHTWVRVTPMSPRLSGIWERLHYDWSDPTTSR